MAGNVTALRRQLILAAFVTGVGMPGSGPDYWGTWTHSDADGSLILRLSASGVCEVEAFERASGHRYQDQCTYAIDDGRVRIRAKHGRDGEGFNALEIKHDPESNTFVIHGDRQRIMQKVVGSPRLSR